MLRPHSGHTNLNLANVHLRRALDALNTLGLQPPGAYLRDPDLAAGDLTPPTETPFPAASTLQPGEQVCIAPTVRHLHGHWSTQTTPTHFTTHQTQQTDIMITPPNFDEEQQTTPRLDNCHTPTQTDVHAIVRYPSFTAPKAVTAGSIPTSPSTPPETAANPPNITSAANKQPNPDHWQYAELIPGPAVDNPPPPALASDYTGPIGGTPRRARSKTPLRSTTPPCTRFTHGRHSDPRCGSPVAKSSSATFLPPQQPAQPSAVAFGQPKRPPPPLPQQQPTPPTVQATTPPPNWWPTTPPPTQAPHSCPPPQAFYGQVTHPWPAYYQPQQPRSRQTQPYQPPTADAVHTSARLVRRQWQTPSGRAAAVLPRGRSLAG